MGRVEEPKKQEWREVADLLYAVTVPGGTIYTYSGQMVFVPFINLCPPTVPAAPLSPTPLPQYQAPYPVTSGATW